MVPGHIVDVTEKQAHIEEELQTQISYAKYQLVSSGPINYSPLETGGWIHERIVEIGGLQ